MLRVTFLAATCAALLLPAAAHGGSVAMREQPLPLEARAAAAAVPTMHFNMLGFKWAGSGRLLYRVHRLHARWTSWQPADDDVMWTGAADRFDVRPVGSIAHARAYELWSRVTAAPPRALAAAGEPAIVSRAQWGANEEIVRAKPLVAPSLRLAVVHHTVSPNTYTRAQAPAIVRGIEYYHVQANGWNDIGYNFLVDRFGTVYEGRGGGITRNVIGAHAEGFNSGTAGVSLLGSFQTTRPTRAMQDALVALLAWRLDVAHVDPLATVVYTSGGNPEFRAGKVVTLRAISGHRDTGPTECPGAEAYALLPAIARRVSVTGLPKLYGPVAVGVPGGPIRFQARLSTTLAWTVTVADRYGTVVGRGSGRSSVVDWRWDSATGGDTAYTWTITAPGVRPATGTLGVRVGAPAPLTLSAVTESPGVLGPGTDGALPPATLSFTLGAPATVTAAVQDATGATVYTIADGLRRAGPSVVRWSPGDVLVDGRYRVVVTARAGGAALTKWAELVVDRTVAGLTAAPAAFSPNHDQVLDSTAFTFVLAQQAAVRLDIVSGGLVVATPFSGTLPAGPASIPWDGTASGVPLYDGTYRAVLTVTDALGDVPFATPVVIDTRPPTLALVDRSTLTFSLDEPATVTVVVNGTTAIARDERAGTFAIPFQGAVASFSASAVDRAGNVSAALSG